MTGTSALLLVLRTVAALGIVLLLLVVALRWLERRAGQARPGRSAQVPLEVITRLQLTKSSSVHVVRAGRQVLVLGVTDSAVEVLTDLAPADFVPVPQPPGATEGIARQSEAAAQLVQALLRRQGRHRRPGGQAEPAGPEPVMADADHPALAGGHRRAGQGRD